MTRYWDAQSKVPYLWDSQNKVWISYDDAESMRAKAQYIKSLGLGGFMLWELSSDRNGVLIDALRAGLR